MNRLETVIGWAARLTGLERQRCRDAAAEVQTWGLGHLNDILFEPPDLDTVVAAVLLSEAVRDLTAQGVPSTKLMKKLRDARAEAQFWPVWAEVRAAAMLIGREDMPARIELEADRSTGRHADFRLHQADGASIDIEFKAIGLSDPEVAWHREAARQFNRLLPPRGLTTVHGWLDAPIAVSAIKRERAFQKAAELSAKLLEQYPDWADVRGISIVGHMTEKTYVERTAARLRAAFGQLSPDHEGYLGVWWANGAPLEMTPDILKRAGAPDYIVGVVSIGQAIAVPWSEINCFITSAHRGADMALRAVDSSVDDHLANLVLDRFNSSSGIRATLLKAPGRDGTILLRRDGRRRLFPFNLLFDADPRVLAPPHRPPSPIQDVEIDS